MEHNHKPCVCSEGHPLNISQTIRKRRRREGWGWGEYSREANILSISVIGGRLFEGDD